MLGTVNSVRDSVCGLHNEQGRREDARDRTGTKLRWNCIVALKIPAIQMDHEDKNFLWLPLKMAVSLLRGC